MQPDRQWTSCVVQLNEQIRCPVNSELCSEEFINRVKEEDNLVRDDSRML